MKIITPTIQHYHHNLKTTSILDLTVCTLFLSPTFKQFPIFNDYVVLLDYDIGKIRQ